LAAAILLGDGHGHPVGRCFDGRRYPVGRLLDGADIGRRQTLAGKAAQNHVKSWSLLKIFSWYPLEPVI